MQFADNLTGHPRAFRTGAAILALSLSLFCLPVQADDTVDLMAPADVPSAPIDGSWQTQNGTEVTIAPCGDEYCGTLSWVVIPKQYSAVCKADKAAFGAQMLDLKNPDASLKTRPIVGLNMIRLKPTADERMFDATIYSVEDGQTYAGTIWVRDHDNTLRLGGGCLGSMCAVTQDWPRVANRDGPPDFTCG